jgi:RNA polymerase sigma-70 factor (ECF subfamily)
VASSVEARREQFEREALPHLDAVYRVALRLAGDPTEAEDLAQETMLKALRAWEQYRLGTNAKAWLLTILRNAFLNRHRRERRRRETADVYEIEPFTVFRDVQEVDPEGRFFARLVDDEVLHAIDALPVEYKEALVLADVEGLSYAEVAEVLEVPVGTVKSRLFRARQQLQKRLYDYAVEMGYLKRGTP